MSKVLEEMSRAILNRERHLFILSGNIFDFVRVGSKDNKNYFRFLDYLKDVTKDKYQNLVTYNPFFGITIARGKKEEIVRAMNVGGDVSGSDDDLEDDNSSEKYKEVTFYLDPLPSIKIVHNLIHSDKVKNSIIVLDYTEALIATNSIEPKKNIIRIALQEWAMDERIHDNGNAIILLTRDVNDLDKSILDRCGCVFVGRIPKPNEKERREFVREMGVPEDVANIFAKTSSGVSLKEISRMVGASKDKNSLDEMLSICFSEKQRILSEEYGDVLTVMNTRLGFEAVGGFEKQIAKLKTVAQHMRAGNTSVVPQGIMFMGPPGTGKTLLAEAFAKEAGVNFIKPSDIKSMWVGESEKRMSKFIDALRDLAPVVVFIDEFDQNQAQRGSFDGDSGVSKALLKKMLEVMSDTSLRGRVLWIFASNRPDLIDPAIKRPGRCDLRIPFLPPDADQLAKICNVAFVQYPDMKVEEKINWKPYAGTAKEKHYTGADMIEVIRRAWEHAWDENRKVITAEDLEWGIRDYRTQKTDGKEIAKMTLLAINECSSLNLLPDNFKEVSQECQSKLRTEKE